MLREHTHYAPGISSIADVEAAYGPIYDASTLSKIAECPRHFEIRIEEGLRPPGDSAPMAAGIAIHYGLEYYYSLPERGPEAERMAIELARDSWRSFEVNPEQVPERHAHLTEEHILEIMRNYFIEWTQRRIEIFSPVAGLRLEDLNLSQVVAARFRIAPDDTVILGESNLIMLFDVDGEELLLAGKPDLPVRNQAGRLFTMDHKSTSSYLSDWWAKTHEVSNKDRGYMAMLASLLNETPTGSIINGIYVGKYATNPQSKAVKFDRFSFDFTEDHITEALRNQLAWVKTIEFYRKLGYFPQGCGYGGCEHPSVCRRDPPLRQLVKQDPEHYIHSPRNFWDL